MVRQDAAGAAPRHERDPHAVQRLAQAVQELDRVEALARPDQLVRSTLTVARCYRELGMHDTAEWYYRQALAAARGVENALPVVDALVGLAEALVLRAAECLDGADRYACLERARDLAFEAAAMAARRLSGADEARVLRALAEVLSACGDDRDACALTARVQHLDAEAAARRAPAAQALELPQPLAA